MHSYQPLWPDDRTEWKPPSPADFTYRDAVDVGRFAAIDPLTTWHTCPHIWHLDDKGRWRCCSKGSSLDSVQSFAEDPADLLACRQTQTGNRCPNYWVILEPRQEWLRPLEVTEEDARAFLVLREGLAKHGVTLLDAIVFHEDHRWWSLHELTSGTTQWSFADRRGSHNGADKR